MQGRLFIVEGATGSGKNTLCDRLQSEGFVVLRGTPSQNSEENQSLFPKAQEIIRDTVFNFKQALAFPKAEWNEILRKFTEEASIQHFEAVRLKKEGQTVFLNRSAISIVALIKLTNSIAEPIERESTNYSVSAMDEIVESFAGKRGVRGFIDEIDGIILMQTPYVGVMKEREGMFGLEDKESQFIADLARRIAQEKELPLLAIDANKKSPEQELELVRLWLDLLHGAERVRRWRK